MKKPFAYRAALSFAAMAGVFAALAAALAMSPVRGGDATVDSCALALDPALGLWIMSEDSGGLCDTAYPPGSTIKPFTVIASMKAGAGAPGVIRCEPSSPETPTRESCWYRPGHGSVDLEKALAISCDRYFKELATTVDWRRFLDVLIKFYLISPDEIAGFENMPRDERPDVMVGHSSKLRIPPRKLLLAYAAIFNGGYLFDGGHGGGGNEMQVKSRITVDNQAVAILKRGMESATRYGTATQVGKRFNGSDIISKTGTSVFTRGATIDRNRTHGWYVGLAPVETPRAAIVIFVKVGTGSHDAVPAALRFWPKVFESASH